jgi:hypothetical protein
MPDQHTPRFTVTPPAWPSRHNLATGFTVRDSAPDAPAWSAYSGDEKGAREYAAAMNNRVREGSL